MTEPQSRPAFNLWELGAAALLFVLGLYMVSEGSRYGFGTITRIGPGVFPAGIGVLIMILSVAVAFEVRYSPAKAPSIPLRITFMIGAGLLSFALLVNHTGLVPATFAAVFISRFAEPGNSLRASLLLAGGMALFGWLVFIVGFHLPLKPFWW